MKIISWNVNGLRSCSRKGFADWLSGSGADILGIQEVRAFPEQITPEARAPEALPHTWFRPAQRPGYSGVALYSHLPFEQLPSDLGLPELDIEGRLQLARFGALTLVNGYFPNGNGKNRDNSRVPLKLEFYDRLLDQLTPALERGEPLLVMGDWNTAHRAIDLARPKENEKTSGFLPEEREAMTRWIERGWIDTFRAFESGGGHYSWWSQRAGARERNIGWRIDAVFASPGAMKYVTDAHIHPEVMGSDHCPISVTVDPRILEG